MNHLLLVRHSLPEIKPDVPAAQWELSQVGRQRCERLAEHLKAYSPNVVITSIERKAFQTGEILANDLGIPVSASAGLHEHERDKPIGGTQESFETLLADFFSQPSRLVFGLETAEQTLRRFSGALKGVLDQHQSETVIVVAHGTVISLWATSRASGDALTFWKRLGMPALVVFSKPDLK